MPYLDGIASGLDTTGLINAIIGAAAVPVELMKNDLADFEDTREAIAGMTNRLTDLVTALEDLDTVEEFDSYDATVSSEDQFSVSVDTDATPGIYTVTVNSLALGETEISDAYADKETTGIIGEGTLTVTYAGVDTAVTIDSSNSSLQGVADAINEQVDGVSAYVIDTGDASTPYKLVVQGQDTGATNTVSIDTTGLGAGTNPTFTQSVTAADASVTINGETIASASNTIDAIPGMTLDLMSAGVDPVTVNISSDTDAMVDKVQAFVDAYNEVSTYYGTNTVYNPSINIEGPLVGESSARRAMDGIADLVSSSYDSLAGDITIFAQIGIATNQDGSLSLDTTVLKDALDENIDDVRALFTDANGPGAALTQQIQDLYIDEETGSLASRSESIESEIESLELRIEDKEEYLQDYADRLRDQFIQMELAIAQLNSTSSYLGAMFASAPASPI